MIIHLNKQQYKSIGLTEKQHDGPEEREGEEHLCVADERVIRVVLRVHLCCECHTGDNIHGEAAKTPAGTSTQTEMLQGTEKDSVILMTAVHCACDYLWMSKASPDSA